MHTLQEIYVYYPSYSVCAACGSIRETRKKYGVRQGFHVQ